MIGQFLSSRLSSLLNALCRCIDPLIIIIERDTAYSFTVSANIFVLLCKPCAWVAVTWPVTTWPTVLFASPQAETERSQWKRCFSKWKRWRCVRIQSTGCSVNGGLNKSRVCARHTTVATCFGGRRNLASNGDFADARNKSQKSKIFFFALPWYRPRASWLGYFRRKLGQHFCIWLFSIESSDKGLRWIHFWTNSSLRQRVHVTAWMS